MLHSITTSAGMKARPGHGATGPAAMARTVTLMDGARGLDSASVAGTCAAASSWNGERCRQFAVRTVTSAPTLNGHFLVNDPALWRETLDAYLLGLAL